MPSSVHARSNILSQISSGNMESEVGNLWVAYLPLWLELKGRDEGEGWAVEETKGVV